METTIQTILEVALQQGVWAALYIYLFFRMLNENAERENRYHSMIDKLNKDIKDGIDGIQTRLDSFYTQNSHSSM